MYTYTFGGKGGQKRSLQESIDKVVVRTRNARALNDAVYSEEGKKILEDFLVDLEFPEADITVLKTREVAPPDTTARDAARGVLKKEEELRFAGRVLEDPDSQEPVLYTENIFIKFHDHLKPEDCEKILAEYDLAIKQKPEFAVNTYFTGAPEKTGTAIFEIAERLLEREEVEFCHPELIREKSLKGIHPEQWHLMTTNINGVQINANVKADLAHLITRGENIIIAIIDDGVDIDHPEFRLPGKVVSSRDVTYNTNDPRPKGSNNHGTACAGVATASGIQASGVAPLAKLMPIRLVSNLGSIAEANAFKWATDHGADIISCSWGPRDGNCTNPNDPTHTTQVNLPDSTRLAIDDAVTRGRNGKGCIITFAAGTGNENVKYDGYASYPKVMAVAASNDTNKRSLYSDYGDSVWCAFPSSDFGYPPFNHPEPLTNGIYTTDRLGPAGYSLSNYTDDFGGTSSACPGVAGTVALMLSVNPDLTWLQVKQIIKETAEKIDTADGQYDAQGHSIFYGFGKVDAEKAVNKALELKTNSSIQKVKIISALINPVGADKGHEKISILNASTANIDITGWFFEVNGHKQIIIGMLSGGEAKTITLDGSSLKLPNTGATINLSNASSEIIHSVTYQKKQVKKGVTLFFNDIPDTYPYNKNVKKTLLNKREFETTFLEAGNGFNADKINAMVTTNQRQDEPDNNL
jgi:subtilisin family serine protease